MMIKENWCWCCADHFVQRTEVLWGPGDLGTIHHEDNCYLTLAAMARHLNNPAFAFSTMCYSPLSPLHIPLHYNLANYKFLVRYKI